MTIIFTENLFGIFSTLTLVSLYAVFSLTKYKYNLVLSIFSSLLFIAAVTFVILSFFRYVPANTIVYNGPVFFMTGEPSIIFDTAKDTVYFETPMEGETLSRSYSIQNQKVDMVFEYQPIEERFFREELFKLQERGVYELNFQYYVDKLVTPDLKKELNKIRNEKKEQLNKREIDLATFNLVEEYMIVYFHRPDFSMDDY